jgi:hypothetical protein
MTAQAAHLRRLAERLDLLTDELTELRHRSDQLEGLATDIHRTLAQHRAQETAGPPNWATMNTEQAAQAWHDLADWIQNSYVPWYDITRDQLPDCWALHRPVVTTLSWLRHTHTAAHQSGAPAHLVADWHTHWNPAATKQIRDAIPRHGLRSCGPGHHLATSTDRALHTARPHPPIAPPATPAIPPSSPTEQLAHREHWNNFYTEALAHDLTDR